MLRDIFDCLSVGRVVHHFEEGGFALVIPGGCALIRVELDVVSEHRLHFEANSPVHFRHLHAALQVKLERLAERNVVRFGEQRTHELSTEQLAATVVESAQTQLLLREHLHLVLQQLRRERIIIIAIVDVCWILKIDFKDV